MNFFRKIVEFFKRKFEEAKIAVKENPRIILEKVRIISFALIFTLLLQSKSGAFLVLYPDLRILILLESRIQVTILHLV